MDHILFLTVYFYLFLFVCLFVFIHFSCSWVTKYLECESLCSSCTRNRNNSYDNKKKNMTKLYMHHFRGGLVYCCIVTHSKNFVFKLNHFIEKKQKHFVPSISFCVLISLFDISLFCKLTFTEQRIYLPVSSCKHVCKM